MSLLPRPILYSFRRCPYAMRARLAILISEVEVEMREVILSNKPKELLDCSPKATVPVLQLADKTVIDESLDIMFWALNQFDPENWLVVNDVDKLETKKLIDVNDSEFKQYLDKYKYASRFPEMKMEAYRKQGENFINELEGRLNKTKFLIGESVSLADIAIFPFVRQFAYVDIEWFDSTKYTKLQIWLRTFLNSSLFESIMKKHPVWVRKE